MEFLEPGVFIFEKSTAEQRTNMSASCMNESSVNTHWRWTICISTFLKKSALVTGLHRSNENHA